MQLLVDGLATWRIAHILLRENGPWRVFRKLRDRLGVEYYSEDNNSTVFTYKYEITICLWCLSVWVGLAVTRGRVARAFAASAVAVLIDELLTLAVRGAK